MNPIRPLAVPAVPAAKLRPPRVRHSEQTRHHILESASIESAEIVALCAPAGFGKTTVAVQWASRRDLPVAWVTCDDADSDPLVLIAAISAALAIAVPGFEPPDVHLTLEEPAYSRRVLPAFLRSVEACARPVTLVLDDVHLVTGTQSSHLLKALVDSLPEGSQAVLAGRSLRAVPVALWRGQGRLADVTRSDLAFTGRETSAAVRAFGSTDARSASAILEQTRGWPVAVYLLSQARGSRALTPAQPIEEFIESELLAPMDEQMRTFVIDTAALGSVNVDLATHVTGSWDSAHYLGEAITTVLLQTDGDGWHRYHPLLQECAHDLLQRENPRRLRDVRSKAADWYLRHGFIDAAAGLALDSGDPDTLGRVLWPAVRVTLLQGRVDTALAWLDRAGIGPVEQVPALSMAAAWAHMASGHYGNVLRYADQTMRAMPTDWMDTLGDDVSTHLALLLSLTGHGLPDPRVRLELSERVVKAIDPTDPICGLAATVHGLNLAFVGDGRAEQVLEDAAAIAGAASIPSSEVEALAMLGLLRMARGDDTGGCRAVEAGVTVYAFHDMRSMTSTAGVLALARVALTSFRGSDAELIQRIDQCRAAGQRLSPSLPWYRPLSGAVMAFASVRRGDIAGYEEYLSWCTDESSSSMAICASWADRARREHDAISPLRALSPAEMRVWELLRGRLTLTEIAAELFLSRETIKSHTISIYRKLGVSGRREAQDLADTWA